MPVKLRLKRQGRKKAAHFAIVAADSRAPRDGRFIEKVGFYNPVKHPARVYIDHEAALKWLQNGAQPTHTVRSLLRHAGITLKFALIKQGKSEEEMERIISRWFNEKMRKPKQKFVMVDVQDRVLSGWESAIPAEATKAAAPAKPKAEEPKAEEPKAEEAAAEAPAVEEAAAEAPAVEEAAAEAPAEEAAEPETEEEKKDE